jgi:hypothetical protein
MDLFTEELNFEFFASKTVRAAPVLAGSVTNAMRCSARAVRQQ